MEIFRLHLAATLIGYVHTMTGCDLDGPGIRWFANMPGACPGGIDLPVQAVFLGMTLENSFGQGGPADIAETNHENAHHKAFFGVTRIRRKRLPGQIVDQRVKSNLSLFGRHLGIGDLSLVQLSWVLQVDRCVCLVEDV